MTVIVLIAILGAIAIPVWRETMRSIHLRSASQLLLANLQWSKGEAAKRNTCIGITFAPVAFPTTGGSYTIFVDDGAGGAGQCNRTLDAGETILRTVPVDEDVTLVSSAFGAATSICFTANGVSCGSQQGNVQMRNTNNFYRVSVSASAGVRLDQCNDLNHDGDVNDANECP